MGACRCRMRACWCADSVFAVEIDVRRDRKVG